MSLATIQWRHKHAHRLIRTTRFHITALKSTAGNGDGENAFNYSKGVVQPTMRCGPPTLVYRERTTKLSAHARCTHAVSTEDDVHTQCLTKWGL